MRNIAVVYWSGTGNTAEMAKKIAEGASAAGANVRMFTASEFAGQKMGDFDVTAFGCPPMGIEQLEEGEFAPMFSSCNLCGKKIALFGSYGRGNGEWMRAWEGKCVNHGAVLASSSYICSKKPNPQAQAACFDMGKSLI
ncbi:MAG: flavodoxin domain-containing protein [Oscillospiraceae bacterium]|jgi:flavodoxin short chain|nr:flavodoxin domain-containing protein [Oscillospiraceae bacterium]